MAELVVLVQNLFKKCLLNSQALVRSGDYHGILNYIVVLPSLSISAVGYIFFNVFIRFTKLIRMCTALISTRCFKKEVCFLKMPKARYFSFCSARVFNLCADPV